MKRWLMAAAVCAAAATFGPGATRAQVRAPAAGPLTAEPDLAVPLRDVVPFGATAAGDVWAFGHAADGSFALAVRRGQAWQLQPPVTDAGAPVGHFDAAGGPSDQHAGEIGRDGTAVLVGTADGPGGTRLQVALGRGADGAFTRLPAPPADVLLADEQLFAGAHVAIAVLDGQILLAPAGGDVESGVLRWDGRVWKREPVAPPAGGFGGHFKILAIAASSPTDAWMLADPAPASGQSVALYRRQADPDPEWVPVALDANPLLQRAAPDDGIGSARAVSAPGDPLTAGADGALWLDLHLRDSSGNPSDATVHVSAGATTGRVDHSWCDLLRPGGQTLCDSPLNATLETARGTRSLAAPAPGAPFGGRVIAGAARTDGATTAGDPLLLSGDRFVWGPGGGDDGHDATQSAALAAPDDIWIGGRVGVTHLTRTPEGTQLASWAPPWFDDLVDVATAPAQPPAAAGTEALVVARRFMILHYVPGAGGWQQEFVLPDRIDGPVPDLRAVAWPTADLAVAVGDQGAIYERLPTDSPGLGDTSGGSLSAIWLPTRQPGAGDLLDVAFDPADPQRGYAVGRGGAILRYPGAGGAGDWQPERLPGAAANADVYAIAFAGRDALIATAAGLFVNDGHGWAPDPQLAGQRVGTVAGLPDGGASVDGRFVRDGDGGPWRRADAPPLEIAAVAAYRDASGTMRSVVSTTGEPQQATGPPPGAGGQPAATGYVLREDDTGWHDEQHQAFRPSGTADLAVQPDPVRAFALDEDGGGWAVGGTAGPPPFDLNALGSDTSAGGTAAPTAPVPPRIPSAAIYRYRPAIAEPGTASAAVALPAGVVRFALGGHAACLEHCANLAGQGIAPDVLLEQAVGLAGALAAEPHGPRGLLYTGGLSASGLDSLDAEHFRGILAAATLPVYATPGRGDGPGGFASTFAAFGAPLGSGPLPPGVSVDGLPVLPPSLQPGARTFYAFDSTGPEGAVRVVVIDQTAGTLNDTAATQQAWLRATLADARAKGRPAIVVGARPLSDAVGPGAGSDADQVAQLLVDEGASAYVSGAAEDDVVNADFGGRLASGRVPASSDAAHSIPTFTTSTLGHQPPERRRALDPTADPSTPTTLRAPALSLLELDLADRDPQTNRAPVTVRSIPLLRDLTLGTDAQLTRGQVTFVNASAGATERGGYLARPAGQAAVPSRADPFVSFPTRTCLLAVCPDASQLEARFTSSDPSIGYFVRPAPSLTDVARDPDGKPVPADDFPLFCPTATGTVTLTVTAGGLSASQTVQVKEPVATDPPAIASGAEPRQSAARKPLPSVACSFNLETTGPALAPPPVETSASAQPNSTRAPVAKPSAGHATHPAGHRPAAVTPPAQAAHTAPTPTVAHQAPVAPSPKPASTTPPSNITGGGAPQPAAQQLPAGQPVASVTPVAQVAPERKEHAAPQSEQAAARYVLGNDNALPPAGVIVLVIALAAGAGASAARARRPAEAPQAQASRYAAGSGEPPLM